MILTGKILAELKESDFYRNIMGLFTGVFTARLIPALFALLMARLYAPADFGDFVLFLSIASLLSVLANGGYEGALLLSHQKEEQRQIFSLAIKTNLLINLSLLAGLLVWFLVTASFPHLGFLMVMVPIHAFFFGAIQLMRNTFISNQHFRRLAFLEVFRALASGILQSLFYIFPSVGLFLGVTLAQLLTFIVFLFYLTESGEALTEEAASGGRNPSSLRNLLFPGGSWRGGPWHGPGLRLLRKKPAPAAGAHHPDQHNQHNQPDQPDQLGIARPWPVRIYTSQEKSLARRYANFPRYNVPSEFFNYLSHQLPVFMIKPFFGTSMLGLYSFSHRYLNIPVQLTSMSVGSVYIQKARALREQREELADLTLGLFKKQVWLGMIPFTILAFWGKEIFTLLFGAEWGYSGELAALLAPWLFAVFTGSPLSTILIAREKQKTAMIFNILLLLTRAAVLLLGGLLLKALTPTIALYSLTGLLFFGFLTFYSLHLAGVPPLKAARVLVTAAIFTILPLLILKLAL